MTIDSKQIVTGAAAEGHGALIGWNGAGSLSRAEILDALEDAGLPEAWAPPAKTTIAQAGRAVQALNCRGFLTRRGRVERERFTQTRTWAARWIVFRTDAGAAEVGDKAGEVVLTVNLAEDGSLTLVGDEALAAEVRQDYSTLRDAELYAAGDVTTWLRGVLYEKAGATSFGVGYYVPAAGRDVASRLGAAMAQRWGRSWIAPLLPVATGEELRIGVARGLLDDVRSVAASFEVARKRAVEENRTVRPGEAARLMADLGEVNERTGAYRALCGDLVVAPIVAEMRALQAELKVFTADDAVRFSLLELNDAAPDAEPVKAAPSPAERAADEALEKRRAQATPLVKVDAPKPAKPAPLPDDSDTSIRGALLELD